MLDIVSLLAGLGAISPLGFLGLYVQHTRKSRELLLDKHNSELSAKDFVIAAKDSVITAKEAEIRAFSAMIQLADSRLKLSQDQLIATDRLNKLPAPEKRADPSRADQYDEIIPLSKVANFYDRIAHDYNSRNTGEYLATYVHIYQAICGELPSVENISVCDLGGGTGSLRLALHDQ